MKAAQAQGEAMKAAMGRFEAAAMKAAQAQGEAMKAAMGRFETAATMAARRFAAAMGCSTAVDRLGESPAAIRVALRSARRADVKADRSVAESHRIAFRRAKAVRLAADCCFHCRVRFYGQANCGRCPWNAVAASRRAQPVCNRACAMGARSVRLKCVWATASSIHRFVPASPARHESARHGPARHEPVRHALEASLTPRPRGSESRRLRQPGFGAL
jgi:hypothetical protein